MKKNKAIKRFKLFYKNIVVFFIKITNFFYHKRVLNEVKRSAWKKYINTGKLIVFVKFFGGLFSYKYKVNKHTGQKTNKKFYIFKLKINND